MIDATDIHRAFGLLTIARLRTLGQIAGERYQRSQITQMAAALAFRSVFGLIPMMAVGLVVLHSFVSQTQMRRVISTTLEYTGLASISIETAVQEGEDENADLYLFGPPSPVQQAAEQAAEAKKEAVQKERLEEWITRFLDRVGTINFGAVGIVGLVLLIYAALSIIVEAEKSFNQILEVQAGKNWVKRVRDYWALLTLGPLLLVMSFGVRQGAKSLAESWTRTAEATQAIAPTEPKNPGEVVAGEVAALAEAAKTEVAEAADAAQPDATQPPAAAEPEVSTGWRGALIGFVGFVATVVITTLTLLIVYTTVPNAPVQVISASAGAAFAAILWEASKWGFTSYIDYSTSYARIYGVLALLPLFLLWIYVTWVIILLGFQVTAVLQRYRSVSREGVKSSILIALGIVEDPECAKKSGLCIVDPASVLLVMAVVADHFARGLPASAEEVADQTGLERTVAADLLRRLVDISLLHPVAPPVRKSTTGLPTTEPSPTPRYALARPPSDISAAEVLTVGDNLTARNTSRPAPVLDAIREAKFRALEGKSLADIHAMLTRREARALT